MRIIKAEDVCEMLDIIANSKAITTKHGAIAIAKTALDDIPVINHESLRPQGVWIDKATGRYGAWQSWCSVCGKHSGIGGRETNRHKPYCPNCGAKLKGAVDHEGN